MITEKEIIEILNKFLEVKIVKQENKMNFYRIGIWLNGQEINNVEIELNTVADMIDKLVRVIAKVVIDKINEGEKEKEIIQDKFKPDYWNCFSGSFLGLKEFFNNFFERASKKFDTSEPINARFTIKKSIKKGKQWPYQKY